MSAIDNLKKAIDILQRQLKALQEDFDKLRGEVSAGDGRLRECQLEINKVNERENSLLLLVSHSFADSVADLVVRNLRVPRDLLSRFDINQIGREGKTRAILKAKCLSDRRDIFDAAKKLRPTNFYVNEVLTDEKRKLFFDARKFRRDGGLWRSIGLYTRDGVIYARR